MNIDSALDGGLNWDVHMLKIWIGYSVDGLIVLLMINIISYNVNGLRDFQKRKKIFCHLKQMHNADIVLLQETHCTFNDERLWQSQWGGKMFNSFGETNARGTALLIGKNVNCEVIKFKTDEQGRCIVAEIRFQDKEIVIAGVYAPNSDKPKFFENTFEMIAHFNNDNIILAGDFNFVFDTDKDRAGTSEYNHPKSRDLVSTFLENLEMCDIWRIQNPQLRKYTCHKRNSSHFSRIDFFLIANSLVQCVKTCTIKASFNSDHSIIALGLVLDEVERGRGFWKFNSNLLGDTKHNELIAQAIENASFRFQGENPALRWEMIKMQIVDASRSYSRIKASEKNQHLKELVTQIEWLTTQLEIDPDGEQEHIEAMLNTCKQDYNELMDQKVRGMLFRSKCRWYQEGERSSKYFFNLKKFKYNKKRMKQIFDCNGMLQSDPKKILDIQAAYFEKLYQRDPEVKFDMENNSDRKITKDQADLFEHNITLEELGEALSSLNDNKTPGADGLTSELYKHFWHLLGKHLIQAFIFAKQQGLLHISARRGIISLIPKKDKDSRYIENWRPITLLNTDYKILAKALVN